MTDIANGTDNVEVVRPTGLFEMVLEVADLAAAIHGGRGGSHVHFALRIPLGTIDAVRARLEALGYATEERDFGRGNRAIYLDDPDGNLVELTERTTLWDGSVAGGGAG